MVEELGQIVRVRQIHGSPKEFLRYLNLNTTLRRWLDTSIILWQYDWMHSARSFTFRSETKKTHILYKTFCPQKPWWKSLCRTDVFPIENGDIPLLCSFTRGYRFLTTTGTTFSPRCWVATVKLGTCIYQVEYPAAANLVDMTLVKHLKFRSWAWEFVPQEYWSLVKYLDV